MRLKLINDAVAFPFCSPLRQDFISIVRCLRKIANMSKSLKELLAEQQAMMSAESSRPNWVQHGKHDETLASTPTNVDNNTTTLGEMQATSCPVQPIEVDEEQPAKDDHIERLNDPRSSQTEATVASANSSHSQPMTVAVATIRTQEAKNAKDTAVVDVKDTTPSPRELPPYFLSASASSSIKGSDWGEVSVIGEYFLAGCEALETVDFGDALRRITNVPYYCMAFCPLLRTIDCSSMVNVTTIGSHFGYGCTSVTTVNLNGMNCVRKIGMSFLEGCTSLMSIDASSLTALEHIEERFLAECHSLEEVSLLNCTKVATIESNFLLNCHELRFVDLPVFRRLERLIPPVFHGCWRLAAVNRSHFPQFTVDELRPLIAVPLVGGIIKEAPVRRKVVRPTRELAMQRQPRSLLMSLPIESFATIYSFLPAMDSSSLRGSCSSTVDAFDMAVELEYYIPCAGSENPNAVDPMLRSNYCQSRWFPLAKWKPTGYPPGAVRVRSLCCLLDSSWKSIKQQRPYPMSGVYSLRVRAHHERMDGVDEWPFSQIRDLAVADIDCFRSVTEIPKDFLNVSPSLHRLKVHESRRVRVVGPQCLQYAGRLASTDFLRSLPELDTILDGFLGYSGVRSIEISRLEFLARIGNYFAFDCTGLRDVKLVNLPSLKFIGNHFLHSCHGSFALKFENLPSLQEIDSEFLQWSKGVESVEFDGTPSLRKIGSNFCESCPSLKKVHLGDQPSLVSLNSNFLTDCGNVLEVALPGLPSLRRIGSSFLLGCASLSSVGLGSMPRLTMVPHMFMCRCSKLREFRMDAPNAGVVCFSFLNDCSSLTTLDLSTLPPNAEVAPNSLSNCDELRTIHVPREDFFPKDLIADATVHVRSSFK